MLDALTSKWRVRAASILVVFYALCVVTPTAVLALGANEIPAHCLTENPNLSHIHQSDSNQNHSPSGEDGRNHVSKCCGLFLVNGVVPAFDFVTVRMPVLSELAPLFAASLSGQDTDRIDRPPRSLLSV